MLRGDFSRRAGDSDALPAKSCAQGRVRGERFVPCV